MSHFRFLLLSLVYVLPLVRHFDVVLFTDIQVDVRGSFIFFLDDKTPAPEVFCTCSFICRAHFKTSLVMVIHYGFGI